MPVFLNNEQDEEASEITLIAGINNKCVINL